MSCKNHNFVFFREEMSFQTHVCLKDQAPVAIHPKDNLET
jgi:hypothetical protein